MNSPSHTNEDISALTPYQHVKYKNQHYFDSQLILFAKKGSLSSIKFLFTDPKLHMYANGTTSLPWAFADACCAGNLSIVQYFLTSQDIAPHLQFYKKEPNSTLAWLINKPVENEQVVIPVLKYILTSPDIAIHPNVNAKKDELIRTLTSFNEFSIIEYLVMDYKIDETAFLSTYIRHNPILKTLFQAKHLQDTLTIKSDGLSHKKHKI